MAIGLLGKKLGMTQVFDEHGRHVAVTAVEAGPCTVLRLREPEKDGYHALQVGFVTVKESKVSRPRLGQFKHAGAGAFRYVHEFRLTDSDTPAAATSKENQATEEKPAKAEDAQPPAEADSNGGWNVGQQLTVQLFQRHEIIDVTGTSIGKGFQGGIKRWGWSGGPASHGSMSHRSPGSIGASAFPSRVLKGHHLPGHMGSEQVTVQNMRVVGIDADANLILIEGAIPGPRQGLVILQKALKRHGVIKAPAALEDVAEEEEATKKGKRK